MVTLRQNSGVNTQPGRRSLQSLRARISLGWLEPFERYNNQLAPFDKLRASGTKENLHMVFLRIKSNYISLIFSLLFTGISSATPTISDFNYKYDMPAVEILLKKEWSTLFWMPHYDHELINMMFKQQKPGDIVARDKKLFISVLKDSTQFMGFVTYYQADNATGHIELLAIDSSYKGKGYGKKMVNFVREWSLRLKCKYLQLYVYTSNNAAIQFYNHLGFTVKKAYHGYYLLTKQIA